MLKTLEEEGLADNTLVVYSADQGFYLGEHGWFDKRWIFEESLRSPLLVRWPGVVKPGGINDRIVSNLDFAETFLDAAGLPIPAEMQGRSLLPLFKGETPADWRKSFYYQYYEYPAPHHVRPHYGVVTDRYKLVHFYTPDVNYWELFDRTKDPNEVHNVADDPANATVVEELKREVTRLRAELKVPAEPPQTAYGNPPPPFGPPAKKAAAKKKAGLGHSEWEGGSPDHGHTHHAPQLHPRYDHRDGRPRRGLGDDPGHGRRSPARSSRRSQCVHQPLDRRA